MKRIAVIFAVLICLLMFLTAQMRAQGDAAENAIIQAALDYMDGAHSGDAARMARAVHPELHKVSLQFIPQTKRTFLRKAGASRLIQLIAANTVPLAEDKRNTDIKILDVLGGLAVVRATSSAFWDYLQLADIDGEWKIVNILWTRNPKPGQAKNMEGEDTAITQTALDYIEGSFSGDAARMARAVHPELHKVIPVKMPKTGTTRLDKMGAGMLIEGTRAKMGLLAEDKRNIEVTVLDAAQDLAMVKVLSARYYDFLQMAKIDGRWQIVNVLWVMNPSALPPNKR